MKKITKTVEMTLFIPWDGKMSFHNEEDCIKYEQNLEDYETSKNLFRIEMEVPFLYEEGLLEKSWYLVRNEKERDFIFRKWCSRFQYKYINGKSDSKKSDIKIGDWVSKNYDYENGEKDLRGVYTLSYILDKYKSFVELVEKNTVSGKY